MFGQSMNPIIATESKFPLGEDSNNILKEALLKRGFGEERFAKDGIRRIMVFYFRKW